MINIKQQFALCSLGGLWTASITETSAFGSLRTLRLRGPGFSCELHLRITHAHTHLYIESLIQYVIYYSVKMTWLSNDGSISKLLNGSLALTTCFLPLSGLVIAMVVSLLFLLLLRFTAPVMVWLLIVGVLAAGAYGKDFV